MQTISNNDSNINPTSSPSPNSTLNMDFPSKNYTKYKSQSKTNPLLNKLNQDIGYPQDVFQQKNTSFSNFGKSDKNYLQMNKSNLKNFFADRLPPKDVAIFKESYTIDPSRLFEIKKRQHELKSITRQKLEQNLNVQKNSAKMDVTKITEIFYLNDKNQDFKKKFLGNTVRIVQPYQSDNHLKGTTSYVRKYNNLLKKKAFNSVFGPQTSSLIRKTARTHSEIKNTQRPYTDYQSKRQNKKINFESKSKQLQRKKFSSLIQKIDTHRRSLDPQNKFGYKPYVRPNQIEDLQLAKTDMITWIKDTTRNYKYNSIDMDLNRIKCISDIEKLDSNFYDEMLTHKARRLQNRATFVQNITTQRASALTQRAQRNKSSRLRDENLQKINDSISVSSHQESNNDEYSISSSQRSQSDDGIVDKRSTIALLIKFVRSLVDALLQARFYGIQNKNNIYKAFWLNPEPYQKSGSYAFFKAIKKGDLEGVHKFLANDYDYVYQRDHKGRSPLVYSIVNNHSEIAQFFLSCDINVNQKCFNRKTALYYALKNQNVNIVKKILQAGAVAWSHKGCQYNKLLDELKNKKLLNLIKNARKIAITIQMVKGKTQKVKLWNQIKHKIEEDQVIM